MAEVEVKSGGKKGPGVKKGKKLSTRIDLTPMVDLGFLLITFFIFTTTMSKPKSMEINMPTEDKIDIDKSNKVKDYCAMTILLSKENRVYYYYGIGDNPLQPPKVDVTYFTPEKGIRQQIMEKKAKVIAERTSGELGHDPKDEITIMIKPDSNSNYNDMVNILDEMAINGINTYVLMDISPVERGFINATEAANK